MDRYETYIHSRLRISAWKCLKVQGFYRNFSPVSSFTKEYEIQYLHYSTYYLLYSAKTNLKKIFKIKKPGIAFQHHLSDFFQDLQSVCDLLAKQLYVAYFNESILKLNLKPEIIYLHYLRRNRFMNKAKQLPIRTRRRYNRIFIKKIKKITNPKNKSSWYNELKYYRNNMMHGILRFIRIDPSSKQLYLLKVGKFEKHFDFVIKNIPIHNPKLTSKIKKRMRGMSKKDAIPQQCQNYFDEVVHLSEFIWEEMLDFYLNSPAAPGVKLSQYSCP